MAGRQLPRWSDLRPLVGFQPVELDGTRRRLARAHTVADLRTLARRRTPRAVFDYADGAAEEEVSLRRAREAFAGVEFHPRVLRDVSAVEPATTILGRLAALPLVLAPTGFTRMMQHEGEVAVGRAAAAAGVPYALSTMGTTSVEDLAAAVPDGDRWFQLYIWRDRGRSKELVERAGQAGYRALMVTVDVPVAGARLRDLHNGLTIPPSLRLRTVADMARYPAWWANLLTTPPLSFASLPGVGPQSVAEQINSAFDPSITFDDLDWLRGVWSGPVVVKGVHRPADARECVARGADGVVVSNHGGRQLDRVPAPLETLSRVVDAVGGDAEVMCDGGVQTGADIAAAVSVGARACLVGRAYLYGLMAGGERGVARVLELMTTDLTRTMQLLGARDVTELDRDCVTLRAGHVGRG